MAKTKPVSCTVALGVCLGRFLRDPLHLINSLPEGARWRGWNTSCVDLALLLTDCMPFMKPKPTLGTNQPGTDSSTLGATGGLTLSYAWRS